MKPCYQNFEGKDWYGHILIGYGNTAFRQVLRDPKYANMLPLPPTYAINEVMAYLIAWCKTFCQGEWKIDPMSHCHWIFTDPRDAVLFKLTHY